LERGLHVDHTTIYRWVQRYAPELEKRCKSHLKATTDSWRVDETYVKVKRSWMYLYRAVDSQGNTLEFLLSVTRDAEAAKRFFAKTLQATHTIMPRVITVDKNAAYPTAFCELKAAKVISASCELVLPELKQHLGTESCFCYPSPDKRLRREAETNELSLLRRIHDQEASEENGTWLCYLLLPHVPTYL
jgi:transposase-like protein